MILPERNYVKNKMTLFQLTVTGYMSMSEASKNLYTNRQVVSDTCLSVCFHCDITARRIGLIDISFESLQIAGQGKYKKN